MSFVLKCKCFSEQCKLDKHSQSSCGTDRGQEGYKMSDLLEFYFFFEAKIF